LGRENQAYKISILLLTLAVLAAMPLPAAARKIVNYAIVQEDGSLRVKGRTIHLFGIYIPPLGRTCQNLTNPPRCASRAALALDFIIQGFVHCESMGTNADRSIDAVCWIDRSSFSEGQDLGAYLLIEGLAVALPEAPFEYHTLEKIARSQGRGMWGFQVDSIERQRD
jgi:endonuclease YncB( thermonuclease family)